MFPLDLTQLTSEQRAMVDLWEVHLKAEFQDITVASAALAIQPPPGFDSPRRAE